MEHIKLIDDETGHVLRDLTVCMADGCHYTMWLTLTYSGPLPYGTDVHPAELAMVWLEEQVTEMFSGDADDFAKLRAFNRFEQGLLPRLEAMFAGQTKNRFGRFNAHTVTPMGFRGNLSLYGEDAWPRGLG